MNKRLKTGGMLLLVSAFAVSGILLALRQWADRPADGTVHTKISDTQSSDTKTTATEPVPIETDYFTTRLPAGFTVKRQDATSDSFTRLRLMASNRNQQFAVTVAKLPAGGLSEVGSFNLRTTNTAAYESYSPADIPPAATGFRALDGPPAFAVFWTNGSLYAEIALTGDGAATLDELSSTFSQAMRAWEWR